jgi:hypothetical protein
VLNRPGSRTRQPGLDGTRLLEGLQRLQLEENDDRPVEISMLLHVTVHREDGSSAP